MNAARASRPLNERAPSSLVAGIEWLPPGALQPHPQNPRTHSRKQIAQIAASIREFGFLNAILIDETNMILAGHGRWEAARLENLKEVAVRRCSHLSATQKLALLLADNKIAESAGWDRELLAVGLTELIELLPADGLDVGLTGFEVAEVDSLLADMVQPAAQAEDIVPALPRHPTTQKGDLWLLDKHRLLCGDARECANFVRLMNGATASTVFCDPPYNLRVKTISGRGRVQHEEFAFASGEMSRSNFREFLSETLGNGVRASAPGSVHYIFMDWRHISDLIEVGREVYDSMLNLVVWNKSNAGQGSFYRSQHELIGAFMVGGQPHRNNVELGRFGRNRSNVWTYAGVNSFGRGRMKALASHPTVKPVALVADALLDCTARGEVVLDQFAGSGTTILAAEKVGRTGFGMEYEPRYVDVAITRWQQTTKREATLADDGRTFEKIAAARAKETAPRRARVTGG
jgi:DNA modification methylase